MRMSHVNTLQHTMCVRHIKRTVASSCYRCTADAGSVAVADAPACCTCVPQIHTQCILAMSNTQSPHTRAHIHTHTHTHTHTHRYTQIHTHTYTHNRRLAFWECYCCREYCCCRCACILHMRPHVADVLRMCSNTPSFLYAPPTPPPPSHTHRGTSMHTDNKTASSVCVKKCDICMCEICKVACNTKRLSPATCGCASVRKGGRV